MIKTNVLVSLTSEEEFAIGWANYGGLVTAIITAIGSFGGAIIGAWTSGYIGRGTMSKLR
jgi:hypothetical protein